VGVAWANAPSPIEVRELLNEIDSRPFALGQQNASVPMLFTESVRVRVVSPVRLKARWSMEVTESLNVTDVRLLHPLNDSALTVCTESPRFTDLRLERKGSRLNKPGRVATTSRRPRRTVLVCTPAGINGMSMEISLRLSQLLKALPSNKMTLFEMWTCSRGVFPNAYSPIDSKESGNVRLCRSVNSKARSPMVSIDFMSKDASPVYRKAPFPMFLIDSLRVTDVRDAHFLKAFSPMDSALPTMMTEVMSWHAAFEGTRATDPGLQANPNGVLRVVKSD
jgi:hypothetical protein